ncbi:MAG: peptidase M75 [Candidatus Poribacteria bacterium]|nr:peptidase M75 [Candidatus Poribacteria bacterium]
MKLYKVWTLFDAACKSKLAIALCCLLLASAFVVGCGGDDETDESDDSQAAAFDASTMLNDFANTVVLATYINLDQNAGELLAAVKVLKADTSQANLEKAQQAWIATRKPWEQSEAFLFGPVDTQGLDPALDSWPVDHVNLQSVLDSGDTLTVDFVSGLEDTQKGFHTIEFLLFRDGNQRKASDITDRELAYLVSTTENLKASTAQLRLAWAPEGENFSSAVAQAGAGSAIYPSQSSAVQEMVNGMIVIADEVANGKISDPYNESDTTLVESQFSFNSISDFQDNIRGIQNVYMGKFMTDGQGLNDFVNSHDPDLDARFQQEVQAAIDAIGAIPDPFRDSITANRGAVQAAIDAVRTVQQTLEADILTLVTSSEFN